MRVSLRSAGVGTVHLCVLPESTQCLSDGYVYVLPAGVSAVRLHLPNREYAVDHPDVFLCYPGAVLHRHHQGNLPKGFGTAVAMVRFAAADRVRGGGFVPGGAKAEAKDRMRNT